MDDDFAEWIKYRLSSMNETLSPMESKFIDYLAAHPRETSTESLRALSRSAGTEPGNGVRIAKRCGFSGWLDLRREYKQNVAAGLSIGDVVNRSLNGSTSSLVQAAIRNDLANLRTIAGKLMDEAVDQVVDRIIQARRVLVISSGSYSVVGQLLVHFASLMGYQVAHEYRGGVHLLNAVANLEKEDYVIAISFWREVDEIVRAARVCAERSSGVCAFTDSRLSPLREISTESLLVPTEGVLFFQSITAAISLTYGLLATLFNNSSPERREHVRDAEQLWSQFGILYNKANL